MLFCSRYSYNYKTQYGCQCYAKIIAAYSAGVQECDASTAANIAIARLIIIKICVPVFSLRKNYGIISTFMH